MEEPVSDWDRKHREAFAQLSHVDHRFVDDNARLVGYPLLGAWMHLTEHQRDKLRSAMTEVHRRYVNHQNRTVADTSQAENGKMAQRIVDLERELRAVNTTNGDWAVRISNLETGIRNVEAQRDFAVQKLNSIAMIIESLYQAVKDAS